MSIQRYRLSMNHFVNGEGWEVIPQTGKFLIHKQPHKRGGWCKWEDVKNIEDKLKGLEDIDENRANLRDITQRAIECVEDEYQARALQLMLDKELNQ